MSEDRFADLYKTAEIDLYERGNCYKTNETSKSILREIRICTPDHFKYEYRKIKEDRQKVVNDEKKKYKIQSENLRNRLKNCYNYYDDHQYYIQKNNSLKKVKLNLINKMTDQIFHTKPSIEVEPKFNQMNDLLTQYIHDADTIENKEIDDEKHIEFIKGLSKTFDQSIKKITKKDIRRIYETGTVVSIAKKRSKFFNENKEDKSINRKIMEAISNMNKELQRLDAKDGIAVSNEVAKQREAMITKALSNKDKYKEKTEEKEKVRKISMVERRKSSFSGMDSANAIKLNETYLRNNKSRRLSISQIKESYDEVSKYVRKGSSYGSPVYSLKDNNGRQFNKVECIYENPSETKVDEFGNLPSFYQSKNPVINYLYPNERAILSKHKSLRNSVENSFIFQLIRPYRAFKKYSVFMLKEISKIISFKIFKRNQVIYKKGDSVRSWHIILEGSVGLYGMNKNQVVPLLTFSDNEDFGKISLFSENPQNYTTKVLSDICLIACLDKDAFIHIIQWLLKYDIMANQKFFKSIPDFDNISDTIIERISNICHTLQYSAGSTIVKENDYIKYVYFIQSGICDLYTSLEVDINQEMKNIIIMYSGYGSKYDMPKYTDPYDRRIVTELEEESEKEYNEHSDMSSINSSYYELNGLNLENNKKEKKDDILDSLIPSDIRVKQVFLGELSKNEYFGEAALIELEKYQKYKSPITVKCKTDVVIHAISIFDLVGLLPNFFKINKYFDMAKKEAQRIYYKQKEEHRWVKIKERELSNVLREQSGNCLKQYCIKRDKIF
ncbi:camp-binding domain-like protein [Neocallimastix lanati (nom. inval.)]|nr:camp-binding domain-like protein [Neocallimastix sp. JGI-2020a]